MSFTESISSSNLLSSFGWTIIHSIWIGGIIFLFAWILLYLFRNGKANHRYTIAVGSLFVFLMLVIVAFFKVYALQNINYGLNLNVGEDFRNLTYNFIEASNLTKLTNNFSLNSVQNYINQNIPILVVVWLVGLLFFTLRFFGGLLYTYRMRSKSQKIKSNELNGILSQISHKIGLRSKVQIKETSLISTPMVIGFIKPIILLPLGMANGLSLHQVEAILFHEIAHIYRFDYLVNLIQSVVEVVLFYHPVVWWLSAHIRAERENICDDIAIKHTGSALDYAKALTKLQELNNQTPDIVLAFSNKKYRFMNRIRRLLGLPLIENNLIEGLVSSLLLIVSIILFTTHAGPVFAQADEENSASIELPIQNDQDQKKKVSQKSKDLKEDEQRLAQILKENTLVFQKEKQMLTEIEKKKISNYASKDEYNKSATKKLYDERIKYLDSELESIRECQEVNATDLAPEIKKEKIIKLTKLQQLEHKKFMVIQEEIQKKIDSSKNITTEEQKKQKELQKKLATKQTMSKEQQKKMQYELQKMEDYQKKVAQFSEQAGEELKQKHELMKQMQLEMEKTKPSEEKIAKFKAMEKELAAQEAKLADTKMVQEKKLKELKDNLKDKIADMREIDELEEAEMEKEIEQMMEVEQIQEATMEKELEQVMEANMAKEKKMEKEIEMARLVDPEMIKKEESYKKAIELFTKNLVQDGLKKNGEPIEFVLSSKQLTINGKKQSKKLFKKYSQLLSDTKGEKLADDKKFILNID